MKKFVLKNPSTGKYWNGESSYTGAKKIPQGLGPRNQAHVFDGDHGYSTLTEDLVNVGALVREYLPDPPKYRVFIRAANGDKLFYGRLYQDRGFWTEEHYQSFYSKDKCHIITWKSINDIPIELRGDEKSTDKSPGYLFWEMEGGS